MAATEAKHELERRVADERASLSSLYTAARALETLDAERLYPAIAAHRPALPPGRRLPVLRARRRAACACAPPEGPAPERPEIAPDDGLVGLAVRLGRPVSVRDCTRTIASLDDLQDARAADGGPDDGSAEGTLLGCLTVTALPFLRLTPASLDRLGLVADWGGADARERAHPRADARADHRGRPGGRLHLRLLPAPHPRGGGARRPLRPAARGGDLSHPALRGGGSRDRRADLGRVLSLVFSRTLRDVDIVCRYATEDSFAIILPETAPAHAEVVVERLSREIRQLPLRPLRRRRRRISSSRSACSRCGSGPAG